MENKIFVRKLYNFEPGIYNFCKPAFNDSLFFYFKDSYKYSNNLLLKMVLVAAVQSLTPT